MKLYVSTYAKYNAGRPAGKWLNLDDYTDADEFRSACLELHKDEADPELMFQDCECVSDWEEGLYSESVIPVEYWLMKAEFSKKKKKKKSNNEQTELLNEFMRITNWGERMRSHFKKNCYFIRLSQGEIFTIDKPKIGTSFCCGEDDRGQGGDDYGTIKYANKYLADKRTKHGFIRANLSEFDRMWLDYFARQATKKRFNLDRYYDIHLRPEYPKRQNGFGVLCIDYLQRGTYLYHHPEEYKRMEGARDLTDEDIRLIRAAYASIRKDFKKRLNAYWKRFGNSKIRTWTYWTEA